MTKSLKTNLFFFALAAMTAVVLNSCGDDPVTNIPNNPPAGTISGSVNFVDTNYSTDSGFYYIAAYATWPPAGSPTGGDTIYPVRSGSSYSASYTISGLPDTGSFVITTAWLRVPYIPGQGVYGLGFYGCDPPNPGCANNPTTVTLSSGVGLVNINFNSRLDRNNALYQF
jgi:hypothetical protein